MTQRRKSTAVKVMTQLSQIGTAAPQVVAHRVARMASAGPVLSARDQKEFTGMVVEKQVAFAQSMQNMWLAGARAQQALWLGWSRAMLQPPWMQAGTQARLTQRAQQQGLAILSQGLAPIERKASSNARRLGRSGRR